jgi:dimeric dUTPase (all-alpha-NTP-PPase superfamily)
MTLHIGKLAKMQRELDKRIDHLHPLEENETVTNRIQMKRVALLVELGELANAWRGFKYWSNNKNPQADMIDEYCDCLHFILSLNEDLGNGESDEDDWISVDIRFIGWPSHILSAPQHVKIAHMFDCIFFRVTTLEDHDQLRQLEFEFLKLGHLLGFTDSQIEAAYEAKNRINHMRQETGC